MTKGTRDCFPPSVIRHLSFVIAAFGGPLIPHYAEPLPAFQLLSWRLAAPSRVIRASGDGT